MLRICLCSAAGVLVAAGQQPWNGRKPAEWTEADARRILTDSPWAKPTPAEFSKSSGSYRRGASLGLGGISISGAGMGGRRSGRAGAPPEGEFRQPPKLTLRWESALPVQEAELKARHANAPSVDENSYTLAVVGIPEAMVSDNSHTKPQGELKREGKKTIKASDIQVLTLDEGNIVLFLFPRSKEVSKADGRIMFEGRFGPLEFKQTFELDQMVYNGKLEL